MSFKAERVFKADECNFCFVDTELSQMMMKVGVFTDVVLQNSFFPLQTVEFRHSVDLSIVFRNATSHFFTHDFHLINSYLNLYISASIHQTRWI